MTTDSYKKALKTAQSDRESLLNERAKIDKKIEQLGKIIESLLPLCDDEESEIQVTRFQAALAEYGLADACRLILKDSDRFMTPISIRNTLLKEGYDLSEQTNPLASVHSIMKRLVESGEAETAEVEGKAFYRWNNDLVRLADVKSTVSKRPSEGTSHPFDRLPKFESPEVPTVGNSLALKPRKKD